jgi:signal transduction histidine kinase/ActR/RegA family two-component response regulator
LKTISIKRKLTLIIMASSTIALLLVSAGFVAYELITFRRAMTDDLTTTAQIIGNQSTALLTFGGTEKDASDILGALKAKDHIVAACLYQKTNIFAVPYFRGKNKFRTVPLHPGPDGWRFDFHKDELAGFQHVRLNGEDLGAVYLQSDLNALYARLYRYTGIILLFTAASSCVVFFLSSRLQRVITRPIFHLAQTARIVSEQKNYSVRAEKQTDDELGQLIDGFNEMLAQIQQRDAALNLANEDLEKRVSERTRDLQTEIGERRRAEESLQQQLTRISLLNQISYATAARQDFDSIVLVVLQQLEDHLPIDYGSAYLLDPQAETFTAIVRGPRSRPVADQLEMPSTIPLAFTPFPPCLAGEMVYVPDINQANQPISQMMAKVGFSSVVGAPLMEEGRVFGLLVLMRYKVDGFSLAERKFIRDLSVHVALAVHQARLYQNLEKAYNELRQTQQTVMQQERLKALGQMASGIAHDVNNALSPIVGFAELIQRGEAGLSADTRKYLGYIKTAGEDIAHIVARLREFYRARNEEESLVALNLNDLIKQVIDMTRPRWRDIPQGRGLMIELRTELESRLPSLAGIESEMREVLTNLILNAVDALPDGGSITVRTRAVKQTSAPGSMPGMEHVILEVSDTGVGMDEATRKQCLEPFFSTKGHRGTGLGLAMVYGVVERHEGRIEIESEPGKGTTMRLVFPVRRIQTSPENGNSRDEKVKSLHILCIDDEPLLRELVREMLKQDGHRVETTDGAQAGIGAFRAARNRGEPFDLVVTDLGMPYLDGRGVAKILKTESPETPVVILTGWGVFMKENASMPSGVDGILSKPPRLDEFRRMFRRLTR